MERIRTFIAIEIPEDIKKKIASIVDMLKDRLPGPSWVRPATLHVTVRFLGGVEKERIEPIEGILERIGSETRPFKLTITGMGGFPSIRMPRVLWIGIEQSQELTELHRKVEQGLRGLGFEEEERAFRPHLTICRTKDEAQRRRLSRELAHLEPAICETFVADGMILFKSELDPRGAIHTPLRHIHFKY